jgi:hypothetical protein
MKKSFQHIRFLFVVLLVLNLASCGNDEEGGANPPYDPSQPVELDSFYPDSGGLATKVIMSGKNLGNDAKAVKVYFNQTRASVISASEGRMYVMTPRQPGDTCNISVVVGTDSSVYSKTFRYRTLVTVTTLAGQKGSTTFQAGTLAEAALNNPGYLCVDNDKNIFLSIWRGNRQNFVVINEENNSVAELANTGYCGAPTINDKGLVVVPTDGGEGFWHFDPLAQWAAKRMTIQHPTAEEQAAGILNFPTIQYKHSFAFCAQDGMVYTRAHAGDLVKFDPSTRRGQLVANIQPGADAYMTFHPVDKHMLYLAYRDKNMIYTYNINTGEHLHFAGSELTEPGWRDGPAKEAMFNSPRQMIFDAVGDIILADEQNHCIRRITPDGMVTTVIGMGGTAGYVDGNSDIAQFNAPYGVCIDKDYTIYIADYGNQCVRKLAVE